MQQSHSRTRYRLLSRLAFAAGMLAVGVLAQDTAPLENACPSPVLAAVGGRVLILGMDGSVTRDVKAGGLIHDAWMLPSGNVLYANGKVVAEVTPDGKTVFEYKAEVQKGGGTYACQRLANGNTLIGENSTGRLLEVDGEGHVVAEVKAQNCTEGKHHNLRMVRKLPNGNILACHSGGKHVIEYAANGSVVWDFRPPKAGLVFAAARLANGNTMISTLRTVTEYQPDGTVVWEFANTDLPGVKITNMTGFHLLPDGNMLIGCYAAFDKETKKGTLLFEITREKKLVWSYQRHDLGGTCLAVQRLGADGACLPPPTIR